MEEADENKTEKPIEPTMINNLDELVEFDQELMTRYFEEQSAKSFHRSSTYLKTVSESNENCASHSRNRNVNNAEIFLKSFDSSDKINFPCFVRIQKLESCNSNQSHSLETLHFLTQKDDSKASSEDRLNTTKTEKTFVHEYRRISHVRKCKSKLKVLGPFHCSLCYSTKTKTDLNNHLTTPKSEISRFCRVVSYRSETQLKRHTKINSVEKPFRCKSSFSRKGNLKRHLLNINKVEKNVIEWKQLKSLDSNDKIHLRCFVRMKKLNVIARDRERQAMTKHYDRNPFPDETRKDDMPNVMLPKDVQEEPISYLCKDFNIETSQKPDSFKTVPLKFNEEDFITTNFKVDLEHINLMESDRSIDQKDIHISEINDDDPKSIEKYSQESRVRTILNEETFVKGSVRSHLPVQDSRNIGQGITDQNEVTDILEIVPAHLNHESALSEMNYQNSSYHSKGQTNTEGKVDFCMHLRTQTKLNMFSCEHCMASFTRKDILERHLKIHTAERTFRCIFCESIFSKKDRLKRHLLIHSGERPFRCTLCLSSFTQKQHLKKHLMIHSGDKPFRCTLCLSSFTQKQHLKKHLNIHSGERPFLCMHCQSTFTQEGHLQRHLETHRGERTFPCTLCDSNFTRIEHLKFHLLHFDHFKKPTNPRINELLNKQRPGQSNILVFLNSTQDENVKKEPEFDGSETIPDKMNDEEAFLNKLKMKKENNIISVEDVFDTNINLKIIKNPSDQKLNEVEGKAMDTRNGKLERKIGNPTLNEAWKHLKSFDSNDKIHLGCFVSIKKINMKVTDGESQAMTEHPDQNYFPDEADMPNVNIPKDAKREPNSYLYPDFNIQNTPKILSSQTVPFKLNEEDFMTTNFKVDLDHFYPMESESYGDVASLDGKGLFSSLDGKGLICSLDESLQKKQVPEVFESVPFLLNDEEATANKYKIKEELEDHPWTVKPPGQGVFVHSDVKDDDSGKQSLESRISAILKEQTHKNGSVHSHLTVQDLKSISEEITDQNKVTHIKERVPELFPQLLSDKHCMANFTRKGKLESHMKIHTTKTTFHCTFCECIFSKRGHLKRHLMIHSGERPYRCTLCQSSFTQNQHLKKHLSLHSGERPFQCTICNCSFNRKYNLTRHFEVHTRERSFSCTLCEASFISHEYLNMHLMTH